MNGCVSAFTSPTPRRNFRMDRLSLSLAVAAFSALVAAATYGVLALLGLHLSWAYAALIALLGVATWLLHAWQEGQLLTDPKGFVRRFMLGLVLKMMMALLLIVLILVAFRAHSPCPWPWRSPFNTSPSSCSPPCG